MIRKGLAKSVSGSDVRRQIQFINKLFEVVDETILKAKSGTGLPHKTGESYAKGHPNGQGKPQAAIRIALS